MSLPFSLSALSPSAVIIVLVVVGMLGGVDIVRRARGIRSRILFATVMGTILSFGLIRFGRMMLDPRAGMEPTTMALAILCIIVAWSALFGPWESETKATTLGAFVFWISFSILSRDAANERFLRLIAAAIALVPAGIWCALFLRYHRERVSRVLMMFFGGMLSTVPILFYDALVRRGTEMHFFLFRVIPQSFNASSQAFVSGQLGVPPSVHQTVMATFVSFIFVGLIEEGSKGWVLKRNGEGIFSSIDDALELAVITAIGFAFAENIINPTYFMGFVQDYLMKPRPDVVGFLSNVAGRSVLTSMVHIVSTGVLGYFLGQAIFASPILRETHGRWFASFIEDLSALLRLPQAAVYRTVMIGAGLVASVALHTSFDFLVTFPDLLPGNPHTFGELLGLPKTILASIPLLLFPALFYVVGGFWLLARLFDDRENSAERGHRVNVETFVRSEA